MNMNIKPLQSIKFGDFIIFAFFVVFFIYTFSIYFQFEENNFVEIEANGEKKIFSTDMMKELNYPGITIEINNGKVRVKKSNCPNKYCQMQGWISRNFQTILCVPNNLRVTILKSNESFDSTNY
jgi:hypothetical protein